MIAVRCLLFVATATAQLGSGIDWRYYTTQDGQPVPGLPDGVEGRIWQGTHGVYDVVLAAPNAVRFKLAAGATLGSRRAATAGSPSACRCTAVGRGEIRWVRPGFNYGPEHNDYDAPCEITVLGVDTNPTFEHAPAPYRVQKRVLVDCIYG
ncbi:hypothetical protein SO694_00060264 [Aureococcus anophagefferens]|uniref:Uncharacterized protein n=1 Tax=Aureococcus anophagefferens TaxID=44056 RepID=A0ABR1FR24_AURAN